MRLAIEFNRKAIHFASLIIPVTLYLLPEHLGRPLILAMAVLLLMVDVIRLHVARARTVFYFVFGRLLRDHERFNLLGATYLLLSSLICMYAFSKPIAVVSLGFLVLGDTMAALVGRAWGRVKILDKSLEGSLACFLSCLLVGWAYPGPELSATQIVVGSFVATLIELLPVPLDDNMRIPLAAGFAMTLIR